MRNLTTLKLFLAILFICTAHLAIATISRVNNTLATDKTKKIYASLQAAHDDAGTTGTDTLLVEGTSKEYTELNCSKKLVIIGTGYFLNQNVGQASGLSSTVQAINFKAGSEGSVIIGLTFSNNSNNFAPHIFVSGIAIIRCYIPNTIFIESSINSLVVLQNYITVSAITTVLTSVSFSGVIVKNNVIQNLSVSSSASSPCIFSTVEHNIFTSSISITAGSFRSNIITSQYATVNVNTNAFQNNLAPFAKITTVPTNQNYVKDANLFVGKTAANNNSDDASYKILPGSAFAKAGYNNEEPGIFGGSEPYVLSGIPPIPSIYELQSDAVANKTDGLNVTIKARANQ